MPTMLCVQITETFQNTDDTKEKQPAKKPYPRALIGPSPD